MSARQEVSLTPNIQKLAIIAGSGVLPRDLYHRVSAQGVECHVIGFKGHTDYITPDFWGVIGKSSHIIAYLKEHEIKDLVFIGAIDKPNIRSLRLDWVTLKFFIKTWFKSFGDSNVLSSARKQLEAMGFSLHGIHRFLPELLMPAGLLGAVAPAENSAYDDLNTGIDAALHLGLADKGQAVIVLNGQVIAEEDKKGTAHMIQKHGVPGAILVKMCKPQQDKDMDLPTIGAKTVELCAAKQMAGIVGHAGHMLVAEYDRVIALANQNNIFIVGHMIDG